MEIVFVSLGKCSLNFNMRFYLNWNKFIRHIEVIRIIKNIITIILKEPKFQIFKWKYIPGERDL